VAVKIRMKRMGRKHRSFFRICATDSRAPRDGRVIEELGTYDPSIPETDARTTLNDERVKYWLGVGAQPSEKVAILIKKYGSDGIRTAEQEAAKAKLTGPKAIPEPGAPTWVFKPKKAEEPAPAAAPAAEAAPAEAAAPAAAAPEQPAAEPTT
jgi:small subunit ribosomal protein S16